MKSIQKFKARFIFLITLLLFSVSSAAANARPWEILSDGRIVIEIFNERLAFHPQDASLVSFKRYHDGTLLTMKLSEAIARPDEARAFFLGPRRKHEGIVVAVNIIRESASNRKRPLLGKFAWDDLPRTNPTRPLSFNILPVNEIVAYGRDHKTGEMRSHRAHERPPTPPYQYYRTAFGPSENGFTWYPFEDPLPGQKKNGFKTIYMLPGSQRIEKSNHDLMVTCSRVGAPFRMCAYKQISKDSLVTFQVEWGENKFPERSWTKLDDLFHRIAATVFDRTEKDFE
jgi:hypothetical protein